ncbi:MAG: PIN/TRAM domain-containing protein [Phycisphaerales bacterium JB065]
MDSEAPINMIRERDREEQQRNRLIGYLRVVFVILLSVIVALGIVSESTETTSGVQLSDYWWLLAGGTMIFFFIITGLDILTNRKKLSAVSAILFGAFAGLILTILLSFLIDFIVEVFYLEPGVDAEKEAFVDRVTLLVKVIFGLGLSYLGASTILQTQDDFRLVIPYVEFAKQIRGTKPFILDTSALIDGRILDIAEVGLIQVPLVVPRFVIEELQTLSDSGDKLKRARGRRGLDILGKLQKNPRMDITIDPTIVAGKDVDQMLVELGKLMPGTIMTTDAGLVRVASIQGVGSMNIHDLANALKPSVIPGEPILVHIIKPGEQQGQGVGYLEDGTMIVAENGANCIGKEVQLTVTSTMQTSAGRLIFGRVSDDASGESGEFSTRRSADSGQHQLPSAKSRRNDR